MKKDFQHILTMKINDGLIEKRFSSNRYLSRNFLALDVSTFLCDKRILLLSLVSKLY